MDQGIQKAKKGTRRNIDETTTNNRQDMNERAQYHITESINKCINK